MSKLTRIFVSFMLLTLNFGISAQGQPSIPSHTPQLNRVSEYVLGAGDLIDISVFNAKELSRILEVQADGKISFPLIGQVQAAGLKIRELEKKLEEMLGKEVLNDPHVNIAIKQYQSQPVSILGAVKNPGIYQLSRPVGLIDVISLAGGPTDKAGDKVYVQRSIVHAPVSESAAQKGSTDVKQTLEISLNKLLVDADGDTNIPVRAGDIITVPERIEKAAYFYVLGDVGKPGAYPLREGERIRLSQGLATAGGLLKTAKQKYTKLVREQEDGRKLLLDVDVEQILSGKKTDLVVQANDLIFVPDSRSRTISQSILQSVGQFLNTSLFLGGAYVLRR